MNFTSQILFFFGAIGVFNSFLISLYFIIFKKIKSRSHLLFGLFLLFLSERALRSLIYFFSPSIPNMYSKSDPIAFIFIGPFLLLYLLSVLKPDSILVRYWKHYISIWLLLAIGTYFMFPFKSDPLFWKKNILTTINIQWLAHILFSGAVFYKHLKGVLSKKEKVLPINLWIGFLLFSVLLLWTIYFYINFTYFVIGSITFSLLFYFNFLFFISNKKVRFQVFQEGKKYSDKKIDGVIESQLTKQLQVLMQEQKIYKNSNLKSADIAKELNISTHLFSQLLNDNLKKSFSVFINEYRIEEAKSIIRSNTKYTLEAIGNESGFHSKSTFYTTFKRIVGMTPSKYKEQF